MLIGMVVSDKSSELMDLETKKLEKLEEKLEERLKEKKEEEKKEEEKKKEEKKEGGEEEKKKVEKKEVEYGQSMVVVLVADFLIRYLPY
ncbi:hypothetical protein BGX38DRAFT_1278682 [Terfezia claveryi]|nr:hypothetical protein BGX38DRAFT_1278682 [Terfezia claveryi]